MKRWGVGKLKFPFLFFLVLLQATCTRQETHLQKPIIKVNSSVLTAKEFGDELTRKLRSNDAVSAKDPANLERVKASILREFIVQSLLMEWAAQHNIRPSTEQVDKELERIRAGYPDDLALRRMLTQEKISPKQWRSQIENGLVREMVMSSLREEIADPSIEDQKSYFEANRADFQIPDRVRLRQIVTSKENDAERIMAQIQAGTPIEDLAKEYSTAPERTEEGLTDWIERGVLEVFDKAFDMRVGQLSGILESPFGFHIYRLAEKQSARKMTFEESQPKIIQALLLQREQLKYKAWLEQQIRRARVFKDDQLLESITVETRH